MSQKKRDEDYADWANVGHHDQVHAEMIDLLREDKSNYIVFSFMRDRDPSEFVEYASLNVETTPVGDLLLFLAEAQVRLAHTTNLFVKQVAEATDHPLDEIKSAFVEALDQSLAELKKELLNEEGE